MSVVLFPLAVGTTLIWSVTSIYAKHDDMLKRQEASYNAELKELHVKNQALQAELEKERADSKTVGLIAATITGLAVIGPAVLETMKEMR
jgi:hypothetical protein